MGKTKFRISGIYSINKVITGASSLTGYVTSKFSLLLRLKLRLDLPTNSDTTFRPNTTRNPTGSQSFCLTLVLRVSWCSCNNTVNYKSHDMTV